MSKYDEEIELLQKTSDELQIYIDAFQQQKKQVDKQLSLKKLLRSMSNYDNTRNDKK